MELLWLKLKVTRTTIFQLFHCVIAIVDSVMMRATDLWLLGRVTILSHGYASNSWGQASPHSLSGPTKREAMGGHKGLGNKVDGRDLNRFCGSANTHHATSSCSVATWLQIVRSILLLVLLPSADLGTPHASGIVPSVDVSSFSRRSELGACSF
jgi:hypothetical protein